MAIKTLTITRTRVDSSVPFWKTHYINSADDPTVATQAIADLEAWIKSQPGIISYNDGEIADEVLTFQVVYDDDIIPDAAAFVQEHSSGLSNLAVTYYQSLNTSFIVGKTIT